MWIGAGLDPASFYTYTFREVSEIIAAKAKRDSDIFKRDSEMQSVLMHRLAHKIVVGYHAPKDFPAYEPLDFGSDQADDGGDDWDDEAVEADAVILQGFFERMAKRSEQ